MGRKEHDQSAQQRIKRVSRASRNAKVPFSFVPVHKLRQHLNLFLVEATKVHIRSLCLPKT